MIKKEQRDFRCSFLLYTFVYVSRRTSRSSAHLDMEKFEVHILGCGSALPTARHFPTSQVVNLREKLFMIDCGEGAQMQLRRSRLKLSRLNHIFISHLHGDHCFGLPGLISTLSLLGRLAPLHIYGPEGLEEAVHHMLQAFGVHLDYEVVVHSVSTTEHTLVYQDRSVSVYSLPLFHRVPCTGYLFRESQPLPHIRREMIDFYGVPLSQINNIKAGADWTTPDGNVIPNSRLTYPAEPARSYAYCSDTVYLPQLAEHLRGIDLLFHEATFADEYLQRAKETRHSTASQAATLARDCEAKRLCIGHFSARNDDETILLQQAQTLFPKTVLAREGLVLTV